MKQTFRWWQNLFVEYTLCCINRWGYFFALLLNRNVACLAIRWDCTTLPALVQWQGDLKNLLFNHEWPNAWQWQVGLGADYLQTFAYYTMGDIFTYGVALVSKAHVLAITT